MHVQQGLCSGHPCLGADGSEGLAGAVAVLGWLRSADVAARKALLVC